MHFSPWPAFAPMEREGILIRCACLVATRDQKLLLVRVRDNIHWYLPSGKIESDETPEAALVRELSEELNIVVLNDTIKYLYTIVRNCV